MTLYLYRNTIDKRYLDKKLGSDYPNRELEHRLGTLSCNFFGDVSYTDPVFEISYSPSYWHANYCWCDDTERWYFINDVTYSNNRMYLHCHVDVLMTYRQWIRDKIVIASRNTTHNNHYLQDDRFKAYSMPCSFMKWFKHDGSGSAFSMGTQEFVLCCVGDVDQESDENEVE